MARVRPTTCPLKIKRLFPFPQKSTEHIFHHMTAIFLSCAAKLPQSTHMATVTILNMEYDMSSIIGHTHVCIQLYTIKLSHLRVDFCCYPESWLYLHANFVVSDLKFDPAAHFLFCRDTLYTSAKNCKAFQIRTRVLKMMPESIIITIVVFTLKIKLNEQIDYAKILCCV